MHHVPHGTVWRRVGHPMRRQGVVPIGGAGWKHPETERGGGQAKSPEIQEARSSRERQPDLMP